MELGKIETLRTVDFDFAFTAHQLLKRLTLASGSFAEGEADVQATATT